MRVLRYSATLHAVPVSVRLPPPGRDVSQAERYCVCEHMYTCRYVCLGYGCAVCDVIDWRHWRTSLNDRWCCCDRCRTALPDRVQLGVHDPSNVDSLTLSPSSAVNATSPTSHSRPASALSSGRSALTSSLSTDAQSPFSRQASFTASSPELDQLLCYVQQRGRQRSTSNFSLDSLSDDVPHHIEGDGNRDRLHGTPLPLPLPLPFSSAGRALALPKPLLHDRVGRDGSGAGDDGTWAPGHVTVQGVSSAFNIACTDTSSAMISAGSRPCSPWEVNESDPLLAQCVYQVHHRSTATCIWSCS